MLVFSRDAYVAYARGEDASPIRTAPSRVPTGNPWDDCRFNASEAWIVFTARVMVRLPALVMKPFAFNTS